MQPGIGLDAVVINRPAQTVDSEGNIVTGLTAVITTQGTWGKPSDRDLQVGERRGEVYDGVVSLDSSVDVEIGDQLIVRGNPWTVVALMDVRIHQRAFVRRAQ